MARHIEESSTLATDKSLSRKIDMDDENNNVIDFIEFRMHKLIEETAEGGNYELAAQMSDALDAYLMGDLLIEFIDGWPLVTKKGQK